MKEIYVPEQVHWSGVVVVPGDRTMFGSMVLTLQTEANNVDVNTIACCSEIHCSLVYPDPPSQ